MKRLSLFGLVLALLAAPAHATDYVDGVGIGLAFIAPEPRDCDLERARADFDRARAVYEECRRYNRSARRLDGRIYRDQTDRFGEAIVRAPENGEYHLTLRGVFVDSFPVPEGAILKATVSTRRETFSVLVDEADIIRTGTYDVAKIWLEGGQRVRVILEHYYH